MRVCPRCAHSNDDVMMICTRCGGTLRPDRPATPGKALYPRVALWVILGVLLMVLIFLVLIFIDNANKVAG